MIETTVHIRQPREEIRAFVRSLPGIISGRTPDNKGIGRVFQSYFAYHWFEKVKEAYLIKSAGGTDDTGTSWDPNSAETIVRRSVRPGDFKSLKGRTPLDQRVRGLLTHSQDRLWRAVFRSNYLRLLSREGETSAKARSAQIAWGILKSKGAQTKREILGSRSLPIGRDTDRLIKACSPGVVSPNSYHPPNPDQVIEYHPGQMEFKITVPYAQHFHEKRNIWPPRQRAGGWMKYAAQNAFKSLIRYIELTREVSSSPRMYERYPWLSPPTSPFRTTSEVWPPSSSHP